ncbi:hypothetical protein M9Y10_013231, partial [Tritrichomonas musculus]
NAFKSIGGKVKSLAQKAVKAIPKVVDIGKQVINAIRPILGGLPIIGDVVNAADTGLRVAEGVGRFGKSILNEVK